MSETLWFLVDGDTGNRIRYSELPSLISESNVYYPYLIAENLTAFVFNFIRALVANRPIVLLDADLTGAEVAELPGGSNLGVAESLPPIELNDVDSLLEAVANSSAEITLFTSGTTGIPKSVTHTVGTFLRSVKLSPESRNNVWGLTYCITHMAGLQVFFQALMNQNTIVNLFRYGRSEIRDLLERNSVSHLSGTPTFYRLQLPVITPLNGVRQVTIGGERSSNELFEQLGALFPSARFTNIYASTEAGAILRGQGELFTIDPSAEGFVRVEQGQLLIHESALGAGVPTDEAGWYHTGDVVEVVTDEPKTIRFVRRATETINIGGYKVNPHEVEDALVSHPEIRLAKVSGKPNSVLGNLLVAEIVRVPGGEIGEQEIRSYLAERLQSFKIPRMMSFRESLSMTKASKVRRTS